MLFKKHIGQVTFAEDSQGSIEIPNDLPIRSVLVSVYTELTNTSGGSLVDGQPFTLIQSLRLIAGTGRHLANISGKYLQYINKNLRGASFQTTKPSSAGSHSSTAVRFLLEIPLADPRLRRPVETMLEHRGLGKLDLEIDFNGADEILSGGSGTAIANTSVQVFGIYEAGIPLNGTKDKLGSSDIILATRAFNEKNEQFSSASSAMQFDITARNNYGRFYIFTESDSVLVNTVLNKATLKSGQKVHEVLRDEQLHDLNQGEFGLSAIDAGVYVMDFLADGIISQALPAGRETSLEFEFDVASPGTTEKITVVTDELFTPPLHLLQA